MTAPSFKSPLAHGELRCRFRHQAQVGGGGQQAEPVRSLRTELAGTAESVRVEMAALENRLTPRLGGAIAASTAVLGALIALQ